MICRKRDHQRCAARLLWPAALLLVLCFNPRALAVEPPRVVVSITPIHSLVAGVMAGVAEPTLLVRGSASPHNYMLKPSQRRKLQRADLVVWVGESVESFLPRVLRGLPARTEQIELMALTGMVLLPPRNGGLWPPADVVHHAHHHAGADGHLWLDPRNAKLIISSVAERLSALDPAHADRYRHNQRTLLQRLDALDRELAQRLTHIRDKPYLVFHDAYHYLEARYGLNAVGAISVHPERKPGARRITQIRQEIAQLGVRCIFSEPQFPTSTTAVISEGFNLKSAVLDPMGSGLASGPSLYFELMRNLAASLEACLGEPGR